MLTFFLPGEKIVSGFDNVAMVRKHNTGTISDPNANQSVID